MYQESETFATDHTTPIAMDKTDNEILAIFENLPPQNEDGTGYVHEDEDGLTWGYSADELEYDKKLSWLMPVWYKFRDLQFRTFGHNSDWIEHCGYISDAILNKGISETFSVLVEAIKWYNSLKK